MKRIETTEEKTRFMLWLPVSMVQDIQKQCAGEMTQSCYIHDLVERDMEASQDVGVPLIPPYEP